MIPSYQQEFLAQFDFKLPAAYLSYLFAVESTHQFNAAYLVVADDLVQFNANYNAAEFYPGYFLIGSNGGGEALAIEKATGYFVITPFIGHDEETPIIIGQRWAEFWQRLQAGNLFGEDT